jgi:acetoin utilization protein AcuB
MMINTIMTTNVSTISPLSTFRQAKDMLDAAAFHHLLVEHDGQLVGIICDQDLAETIAQHTLNNNDMSYEDFESTVRVADIMTVEMWIIDRDTPIDTAAILILENNISCLPIVDAKMAIEGIVTWKDLLKHFVYR